MGRKTNTCHLAARACPDLTGRQANDNLARADQGGPSTGILENENPSRIESSWDFLNGFGLFVGDQARHYALPSDIEVICLDVKSRATSTQTFHITKAPIIFAFHISGSGRGDIRYTSQKCICMEAESGRTITTYTPNSTCNTQLHTDQRYRIVNVYITPAALYTMLDEELGMVPRGLRPVLEGSADQIFCNRIKMSPQTRTILDQITNNPYQGAMNRLYLECKSRELIIRQLYEMSNLPVAGDFQRLRPDDIERIHEAKRILLGDLERPPSLDELARRVGVGATKLKRGFRQVYGSTAYNLLRQERLHRARSLLMDSRLNVTEVAYKLGFSDTSHFIREFSRHYGTTPGRFSKDFSDLL
jgi:AraC-like DNA-binding protein